VLLVGCEPHILSCEETGYIGLSEAVEAAIVPAIENIRHLVEEFMRNEAVVTQQEVCSYERT
jgi:Ni,Fe-hydrogenase maturation factor